jgi:excisionase family DNA binding protein
MMSDTLIKIEDVARITGYAVATLYDLTSKGNIPCIRLSRKALRFDRAEIERWIESHRKGASPEAPHVADVSKEGDGGQEAGK